MTQTTPYVIIGNGIAGITAAETLRNESPQAQIFVIANASLPVYYRPALKDYLALYAIGLYLGLLALHVLGARTSTFRDTMINCYKCDSCLHNMLLFVPAEFGKMHHI
ncbi:MAG TPA: FAD/NAD(P)-binding oxidoreductase [Ktedonobacteraceae bacterium]|jgi:hypothetical protein|nr:FAD/NAD(P)-binding oxidoreductase [Ktedonobacteraceae bacterium]